MLDLMLWMDLKFVARFNAMSGNLLLGLMLYLDLKFVARFNVMSGNLLLDLMLCLDLIIFSFFQLKVAKDRKKGDKIVNDRSVWAAF